MVIDLLLSRKTEKDFRGRNMKKYKYQKLGMFPNFENLGVRIHL